MNCEIDWVTLGNFGSFLEGVVSVGMLIVVSVSLFYALIQIRETIRQNALTASATIATVYHNVALAMIEIDRFFAEKPNSELKQFFYDDKAINADHPEYERVMSVAEMMLDHWDLILVLGQATPTEVKRPWKDGSVYRLPWEGWEKYIISRYQNSPAIREFWTHNCKFYSPELANVLPEPSG